jgi:predicted KAP-like P-loop ATPase
MHASRIIYWHLKQERDMDRRGQILIEALKETTGLYLPIIRIASLEDNKEKPKKDADAFIVTDADLETLHQICVDKIEQAAGSGILASHPNMLVILYRWREWSSPTKPREWVKQLVESREGILSFLTACLNRSTSQGMGDYVPQEHWRINLKTVEDFVNIDALERKVSELSCENLNDKQKKAVDAFRKAIKRRQEGKSDDNWRDDEDG